MFVSIVGNIMISLFIARVITLVCYFDILCQNLICETELCILNSFHIKYMSLICIIFMFYVIIICIIYNSNKCTLDNLIIHMHNMIGIMIRQNNKTMPYFAINFLLFYKLTNIQINIIKILLHTSRKYIIFVICDAGYK